MTDSSIIALATITLLILAMLFFAKKLSRPKLDKKYYSNHWQSIIGKHHDAAILAADSLVDKALKASGIKGQTTGDRINRAAGLLHDVNGLWSAHKLRNRLAHEVDVRVSEDQYKNAMKQFKSALKDLGAL